MRYDRDKEKKEFINSINSDIITRLHGTVSRKTKIFNI